jgi:hypothetical protein
MKEINRHISLLLLTLSLLVPGFTAAQTIASFTPDFDTAAELYRQKQYPAAFSAFSELAETGDPRAQTITALMYKFGEGTEQDLAQAFTWYFAAAQQGYPAAQYHTGVMLADGQGIEANQEAAIKWLTLSAENGFDRAIEKLADLNASVNILGQSSEELLAWSTNWDLSLPTELRLNDQNQRALEADPVYLVQVGAMSTQGAANKLWQVLTSHHQALFKDRHPIIKLASNTDRRVYRIQTGPFDDFRSADEFCNRLMASTIQAGCLPIKQ